AMGEPLRFEGALASRLDLFKPSLSCVHDFLEKRTPKIARKLGFLVWLSLMKTKRKLVPKSVVVRGVGQRVSRDTGGSCPGDGVQHNGGVQTPIIDNKGGYTDANIGDVCFSVAMSNMECVKNYTAFGSSVVDVVDFLVCVLPAQITGCKIQDLAFNVFTGVLPDVTYARNSFATPTGALSYQPREHTRAQNDSGLSGSSSSERPRVYNDGQSRNPSEPPNPLYTLQIQTDPVASLVLPAACHCQTETCLKKEKKKKALA
ncbi:hypothetical protein Tco_0480374, partial [Tanacetum coccineum]